jgi:cob(I)alamin adenosyltransferase
VARAVCRRDEDVSPEISVYLNRLGDFLFALARYANHAAGTVGIIWAPRAKAPED